MKIKVIGLGRTYGKRLAVAIQGQLRTAPFRVIQNTEISFGTFVRPEKCVTIDDIGKGEGSTAERLGKYIQKVWPGTEVVERHTVTCSFPTKSFPSRQSRDKTAIAKMVEFYEVL